jgi:hypothetical protein
MSHERSGDVARPERNTRTNTRTNTPNPSVRKSSKSHDRVLTHDIKVI